MPLPALPSKAWLTFQPSDAAYWAQTKDGRVTAIDLDWSDRSPYVQQFNLVSRLHRRMNKQGDGRLTRDEFMAFFDRASAGRDYVTAADLAELFQGGLWTERKRGR